MYESLINHINSYTSTPLSDSESELIKNAFVPKKLRKRQYFLQEGQVCKYGAFIVPSPQSVLPQSKREVASCGPLCGIRVQKLGLFIIFLSLLRGRPFGFILHEFVKLNH